MLDQNLCSKEGRVYFSSKTKSLVVTLQKQQIKYINFEIKTRPVNVGEKSLANRPAYPLQQSSAN